MPAASALATDLEQVVGRGRVLVEPEDVIPYSFDGTAGLAQLPAVVVFPRTTAEVAGCVRAAADRFTPIVTRGSGTGLSGGGVPTPGAIVLCLARMNQILAVDPRNLLLRAQAGAITQDIDQAAAAHGLLYPPDPGSMRISTIGGNLAENSGGLRGLKYGVTRDYVMALKESSWCCGAAGVYAVTQPAQADALLDRKVGYLRATGAAAVASANPGCQLQLERGLRERAVPMAVVHPISLLADAYRREGTGGVQ